MWPSIAHLLITIRTAQLGEYIFSRGWRAKPSLSTLTGLGTEPSGIGIGIDEWLVGDFRFAGCSHLHLSMCKTRTVNHVVFTIYIHLPHQTDAGFLPSTVPFDRAFLLQLTCFLEPFKHTTSLKNGPTINCFLSFMARAPQQKRRLLYPIQVLNEWTNNTWVTSNIPGANEPLMPLWCSSVEILGGWAPRTGL